MWKPTADDLSGLRTAGLLLGALLALALQRASPHAGQRGSVRANAGVWLSGTLLLGAICATSGLCTLAVAQRATAVGFGLFHVIALPSVAQIVLTVLVLDFISYLWHRANHVVPLLWRFHSVHHSDLDFTVSTGLRFHPGELLLSLPLRLSTVALLGAPVAAVVVFEVLFNFSNLAEHGDTDLPESVESRLARIFVTPALHRRHHTRRYPDLDSNYSTIFSFWDRAFGTLRPCTSAEHVEVGLPEVERSLSVLEALCLPFAHQSRRS